MHYNECIMKEDRELGLRYDVAELSNKSKVKVVRASKERFN